MTSRKRVSIEMEENAKVVEGIVRVDGKIISIELDGRINVEISNKSNLRKLTASEKHDYKNSLRTLLTYNLGIVSDGDLVEETVEALFNEYEKMRIRSFLKANTPKKQEVDLELMALELDVEDETLLDVLQSDFEEKDFTHVFNQSTWVNGERVSTKKTIKGFKGLRIK